MVPSPNTIVERSLQHFLDPQVSPFDAPQVGAGTFEHLEGLPPERRPMEGVSVQGALLPQGLLALKDHRVLVLAPSIHHPGSRILRPLSINERLRMHQSPLELDAFVRGPPTEGADARSWKLVQDISESLTPDMYVSMFRQLWGFNGG